MRFRERWMGFVRCLIALALASGVHKADTATRLVREDGIRPVAVLPRPDGTALFLDRSRRLYAVRRDSPRPVLLGCFSEELDPGEAIGLRVAGELAFVAVRRRGGSTPSARCQTWVHPFQTLADSYRSGPALRISGSECFVAAAFDLSGRRIFLSSEDSPTVFVADLEDRGAKPQLLVALTGNEPLGALYFETAGDRLFALQRPPGGIEGGGLQSTPRGTVQGPRGVLWEVDLRSDPPEAKVLSSSLGRPSALAFDAGRRRLYVTDAKEGRIWAIDCHRPCGEPDLWLESELLADPAILEVGLDGTLWVGDLESKLLLAIAPGGEIVGSVRSLSRGTAAKEP